jgi:hypothetical protein
VMGATSEGSTTSAGSTSEGRTGGGASSSIAAARPTRRTSATRGRPSPPEARDDLVRDEQDVVAATEGPDRGPVAVHGLTLDTCLR